MTPRSGGWADRLVLALVIGFVVAFAALPAAYLFATSLAQNGGLAGVGRVLDDRTTSAAIGQSLLQGGLSAALAVAVGYPTGVFLGRYRWRGSDAVRALLLVPFLLPSLVVVVGLIELFGPSGILGGPVPFVRPLASGLPGIVAANLLFNVPLVALFTATALEGSSVEVEETVASLGGDPWKAYRESWARPSWTGATVGGLLTFVFSALSFAPPLLLCGARCATVEVRVWQLAAGSVPSPAAAGVLAFVLVLGFLAPAAMYLALVRRLAASRSSRPRARTPVPWRRPSSWALAAVAALVMIAETALLGVVVARSVAPAGPSAGGRAWTLLFSAGVGDRLGLPVPSIVANSLIFAALAAAVALVVSVATAFVALRRPSVSFAFGLVTFVPVLLSPIVLAFALARFWGPVWGGSPNVWLLIVLSQALLGLPFALQSLELPLAAVPGAALDAARALGASGWGAFVDGGLPRVVRGVEQATLFALALGLGEFTATYFLVTPGVTTLPVAVFALETRGLAPAASAAAALLLVLSLVVYVATIAGARRVGR